MDEYCIIEEKLVNVKDVVDIEPFDLGERYVKYSDYCRLKEKSNGDIYLLRLIIASNKLVMQGYEEMAGEWESAYNEITEYKEQW